MKCVFSLMTLFVGLTVGAAKPVDSFNQVEALYESGIKVTWQEIEGHYTGRCVSHLSPSKKFGALFLFQSRDNETKASIFYDAMETFYDDFSSRPAEISKRVSLFELDWNHYSPIEYDKNLYFQFDMEPNNRFDSRFDIVQADGEIIVRITNLISQKLYFMEKSFKSSKNQILGFCRFFKKL